MPEDKDLLELNLNLKESRVLPGQQLKYNERLSTNM